MRKIVIASGKGIENTDALVCLIEVLFPECEVHVIPVDEPVETREEAGSE